MKTKRLGQIFVNDALIILDEAEQSFARKHWHRTVRKAQEAIELALKGLLRWTGIEFSKVHKIGEALKNPKLLTVLSPDEVPQFATIADNLAIKRGLAFYGSDDKGASELFTHEAARKALDECRLIVRRVEEIIFPPELKETPTDTEKTENESSTEGK